MNIGEYIANENRSIQKVDSLIEMCILIMEKNDHLDFFNFTKNDRMAWRMNKKRNERVAFLMRSMQQSIDEIYTAHNENK